MQCIKCSVCYTTNTGCDQSVSSYELSSKLSKTFSVLLVVSLQVVIKQVKLHRLSPEWYTLQATAERSKVELFAVKQMPVHNQPAGELFLLRLLSAL